MKAARSGSAAAAQRQRSGSAAAAQRQRSGSAAAHAARPYAARGEGHSPAAPNDNDEI